MILPILLAAAAVQSAAVDGGRRTALAADLDHGTFDVCAVSANGRALVMASTRSDDDAKLLTSIATLATPDGKGETELSLGGLVPAIGDVSVDGSTIAVVATGFEDPNADPVLMVFGADGKRIFRRNVELDGDILASPKWIAFWSAPPLPGAYAEDPDEPPPSQAAAPADFLALDGTHLHPIDPIGGALAKTADGGLVSVAGGQLSIYRPELTRKARVDLGFEVGLPFTGGDLIAVGDYTDNDEQNRKLQLFDANGKKQGTLEMHAVLGIQAAVAPDGSAVAATPATPGDGGPEMDVQDGDTTEVVLVSRAGAVRWRHEITKRVPQEHVAYLSVSKQGKRTAVALHADDDATPDHVMVLDEKGNVVWEADHGSTGLWLDPSGTTLLIADSTSLTRLKIPSLARSSPNPL